MKELLRRKSVRTGLLLIILIVVVGIVGINVQSAQRREEYNGHVAAAEKYLSELEYEQAIAQYNLALEIEPNAEGALDGLESTYLAYAQSVAYAGDYERAIAILEEGYELTGRESLRERISSLQADLEEKRKEEERRREEEKREEEERRKEEIKAKVESKEMTREFDNILRMLERTYFFSNVSTQWSIRSTHLTDNQMKELCRGYIDLLEQYRECYEEDWYNHPNNNPLWWRILPELYYAVGEYELCIETRKQLYEVTGNDEAFGGKDISETENRTHERGYDEYGRYIYEKTNSQNSSGSVESERWVEYGENGKPIKAITERTTVHGTGSVHVGKYEVTYEYDHEGRPLKETEIFYTAVVGEVEQTIETTYTYVHNEKGFTMQYHSETRNSGLDYISVDEFSRDFEIDEYGMKKQQIGKDYDIMHQLI